MVIADFSRTLALGLIVGALHSGNALAAPLFSQGFEVDTAGWVAGTIGTTDYGTIRRVSSGTGGIASAEGNWHAIVAQGASQAPNANSSPFTRWGGYSASWTPGGFYTSLDVYLDTQWALGTGFDFSSAINNQSGAHLRDFIFHVTRDTSTGRLLVGGSNNSNFAPREDLESINNYEVLLSGWYTLQHVFRDAGGVLAVDMNLVDVGGNILFTETRSAPTDLISTVVGGNRYGWFTFNNVSGGLAIDDAQRGTVPLPGTLALAGLGLLATAVARRRRF